jgi:hypothetical protein
MASIKPIFLQISPPVNANVNVFVRYGITFNNHDIATKQNYREVCQLIGDDTPGDGIDDALHTVLNTTTVFNGALEVDRSMSFLLPARKLDEDNGRPFPEADEIRARVTLLPIPTSRESNQVVIGDDIIVAST